MPDPFWMEVEAAYNTVSLHPDLMVDVERGDKVAIVKYSEKLGCIFVKIMPAKQEVSSVELNPLAKNEEA